jgi:hypothetical protein
MYPKAVSTVEEGRVVDVRDCCWSNRRRRIRDDKSCAVMMCSVANVGVFDICKVVRTKQALR